MKKKYLPMLLLVTITLINHIVVLLELGHFNQESMSVNFYEAFSKMMFAQPREGIEAFLSRGYYVFLCAFLWGTYIYKDLCGEGIYCFIRYKKRENWFFRKVANLFLNLLVFVVVYVIISFVVALRASKEAFTIEKLKVGIVSLVAVFVMLCLMIVALNLLAIKWGSFLSFAFVSMMVILSFGHVDERAYEIRQAIEAENEMYQQYKTIEEIERAIETEIAKRLSYNPIASFVMDWTKYEVDGEVDLSLSKTFHKSYQVQILYIFVVIMVGGSMIRKSDFTLQNRELEL